MKTQIDMSKEARNARYNEFIGLKSLPFWNEEQEKRYCELFQQRKIDNDYAFNEDKKISKAVEITRHAKKQGTFGFIGKGALI